ncbi:hypothetical protein TorRG33x02_310420, partial [Trema orientale]
SESWGPRLLRSQGQRSHLLCSRHQCRLTLAEDSWEENGAMWKSSPKVGFSAQNHAFFCCGSG